MKIRHGDIESLIPVLNRLGPQTAPFVVYFVARNIQVIRPIMQAIQAARAPVSGFEEYTQAHKALCLKHAKCDAQARPISESVQTPGGLETTYAIEDQGAFDAGLVTLNEKHVTIRAAIMEQQAQLRRLLHEAVEVELVTLRMSDCPKDVIDGNTAGFLMGLNLLEWDIPAKGADKVSLQVVPDGVEEE